MALSKHQKFISKFAEFRRYDQVTARSQQQDQQEETPKPGAAPDFVYRCPNPTLVFSDAAVDISKLDPEAFALIGSMLILFGPDIYWPGLVRVSCPLCGEAASPHGWCKTLRRIKSLRTTYFLAGRRYKCKDCKGG